MSWVGAPIRDEVDLDGGSASAVKLATQLSIKAYVDAQVDTADDLSELGDTLIASVANAQVLVYDDDSGSNDDKWKNVAISSDATISNAGALTIAADAVTNTKLANITRGSVKVGGSSDVPTDLVAKTSGQILVGDGTDVASVAVSGDVTLAANGAVTIASTSGEGSMLNTNVISGQTAMTGDVADADELMVADAGTVKRADFSVVRDAVFSDVSGDIAIAAGGAATIQANSIALGTDTTGNYVATVTGTANEVEVSGSGSETAGITIGLPDDVTIAGNLTISGTTTTVNTTNISVEDPLAAYATGNTGNLVDIGFYGKYRTNGTDLYLGLAWNADQTEFILFEGNQAAPTTTVNIAGTGYALSDLRLGAVHAATLDGGTY